MNTLKELSGFMSKAQKTYEVCAHNIANVNTGGFKRFLNIERNRDKSTYIDTTPGAFRDTHNPTSAALKGETYFAIQTKNGVMFTRNGDFRINENRQLVTPDGNAVLGEKGPVTLKNDSFKFDRDGNIYDGETKIDSLLLVEPDQNSRVAAVGDNLFTFKAKAVNAADRVVPGSLEDSNVDPMMEMTRLVTQVRNYEIAQRFVKMRDSLLGKISTEIGSTN